jgi:hypothetical protein
MASRMRKEPSMNRHHLREARTDIEERDGLLRDYAAGKISWLEMRRRGFRDYLDVLAGLGEIGLRPPLAPPDGPSREARERGRALLRRLLRERTDP